MKERGVLGGSILGITLVHASVNVASAEGAAGRSVEKGRALAAKMGRRANSIDARRNILGGGSVVIARLSQGRRQGVRRGAVQSLSSLFFVLVLCICEAEIWNLRIFRAVKKITRVGFRVNIYFPLYYSNIFIFNCINSMFKIWFLNSFIFIQLLNILFYLIFSNFKTSHILKS